MNTSSTPPAPTISATGRRLALGLASLVLAGASLWIWSGSNGSLSASLHIVNRLLPASAQLQTEHVQGSLRQGGRIGLLTWRQADLTATAREVQFEMDWRRLLQQQLPLATLRLQQLHAEDSRTSSTSPPTPLSWPLRVDTVWQVDALRWTASTTEQASDIRGRYVFDGQHHRLQIDSLQWAQGHYKGLIQLQAAYPVQLDASLQGALHMPAAGGRAAQELQAQISLQGPLSPHAARQRLQARVQSATRSGTQLDVSGELALQGPAFVHALQAHLQRIDLATLWPSAPHTQIDGHLQITPADAGWQLQASLNNALPGTWDQGRLPLEHLQGSLRRSDARWQAEHVLARWRGGQLQGQGQWGEIGWSGDWRVQGLQPGQWWTSLQGPVLSGQITTHQDGAGPVAVRATLQPQTDRAHAENSGLELEAQLDKQLWKFSRLDLRWQGLELQAQGQWRPGSQQLDGHARWTLPGLQGRMEGFISPQQGEGSWHIDGRDIGKLHQQWRQWSAQAQPLPAWLQSASVQAQGQWRGGWKQDDLAVQVNQFDFKGHALAGSAGPVQLQLAEPVNTLWRLQTLRLQWPRHRWWLRDAEKTATLNVEAGDGQAPTSTGAAPILHARVHLADLPWRWTRWLGLPEMPGDLELQGGLQLDWDRQPRVQAWLERSRGDLLIGTEMGQTARVPAGVRTARAQWRLEGPQATLDVNWDSAQAGQLSGQLRSRLDLNATTAQALWPEHAPISGQINARLPRIGAWAWLAPPGWRVQGSLDAQIELNGTRSQPQWDGQVRADDLVVRSAAEGIEFQRGKLRARLQEQAMVLESFELQGAGAQGGSVAAHGQVRWPSSAAWAMDKLEMDLQMQARSLRVTNRADRRLSISGDVNARLDRGRMRLRGTLQADSALFILPDDSTPTLGKDVVVVRAREAVKLRQEQQQALSVMGLPDVQVLLRLGPDFQLRGQGMQTRLAGEVQLVSNEATAGQPRLTGEVRTAAGRYRAYGQSLDIEQGLLRFSGPYDNPALDILALRPNLAQRVGVRVTGTAMAPVIRLYAEPDMPDADKLAWLVLGRSPAAGGAESAVLQQAALALLGGNSKGLSGELASALGLDDLSLANRTTTTAAGTTATGTALMLGKRLSRDFYLAYESSVSGAFGNLFIFYDLSRKLTLRAQTGELNALDLIYTIRHD